jgi:hypothetical protein
MEKTDLSEEEIQSIVDEIPSSDETHADSTDYGKKLLETAEKSLSELGFSRIILGEGEPYTDQAGNTHYSFQRQITGRESVAKIIIPPSGVKEEYFGLEDVEVEKLDDCGYKGLSEAAYLQRKIRLILQLSGSIPISKYLADKLQVILNTADVIEEDIKKIFAAPVQEQARNTSDERIEKFWAAFFDVPKITGADGRKVILRNWNDFPKGTDIRTIWDWFGRRHSKGINYLIENQDKIYLSYQKEKNSADYVDEKWLSER